MCLCRLGFGRMAEVGEQTSASDKQLAKGLAYLVRAVPRVLAPEPLSYQLEIDGERSRVRASSIVVTNVGTVGLAELHWGRQVRPDDGVLDVFVVEAESIGARLEALRCVLEGEAPEAEGLRHLRARRAIRITGTEEQAAVADGEPLRAHSHRITPSPQRLSVLVPAA